MTVSRAVNTMGQGVAVPLPKFLSDHLTLNPTKGKGRLCGFSDKGIEFICLFYLPVSNRAAVYNFSKRFYNTGFS